MFELMLDKAAQILDPFEQAFFIMVQLPYLQPFDDVNKRQTPGSNNGTTDTAMRNMLTALNPMHF